MRGIGTSPGARTVRGAARVSAAVARHVAHVRVEVGADGVIGERDAPQWPADGVPDDGWERSYSRRDVGLESTTHASLISRMRSAASAAPSWRSG